MNVAPSLSMKYLGVIKEKGWTDRTKWGYPKMRYHRGFIYDCETPCSIAVKARAAYTYQNMELRMFNGILPNGTALIKISSIVERAITTILLITFPSNLSNSLYTPKIPHYKRA